MASESVKLFRLARFEYKASASVTVQLYTDLPGDVLTLRETLTLPASGTRRTYKFRLQGTSKGQIYKVRIIPSGSLYLYGGALYVRKIGRTASDWFWHPLPIVPTQDGYTDIKLPIEPTPDEYSTVRLPIEPTPDDFSTVKLPIEPTPDEFSTVKLPIEPTPDNYAEVRIPMRPSPDEVAIVELPMDE